MKTLGKIWQDANTMNSYSMLKLRNGPSMMQFAADCLVDIVIPCSNSPVCSSSLFSGTDSNCNSDATVDVASTSEDMEVVSCVRITELVFSQFFDNFFWNPLPLRLKQIQLCPIVRRHICSIHVGDIEKRKWMGNHEGVGAKISSFNCICHRCWNFYLAATERKFYV